MLPLDKLVLKVEPWIWLSSFVSYTKRWFPSTESKYKTRGIFRFKHLERHFEMSRGNSSFKEQQTEWNVKGIFHFSSLFAYILLDMSDLNA